ncbi:putative membrane protein [Pseudoalteromonas translucida]|uniref:Membrane protein n=1 Tax=Pseudoalteromonas translucida (strain TAC 125) TaxID=326442 RepID=Q3IHP4_PSET1|nr:putative membrane protein [Pseudoalteromonas translucida]|tara:strand:- start:13581 stop:14006 length:426 start_codon:yes stop_codon:yes gene_type:complete
MSLNALSCNHTNVQLAFGESALCGRLNKAGKGVCVAITLVVFNTLMLLSGAAEDAFSLEALLSDNTFVEPLLLTIAEFLAYPIISSQLLIGLCWLLFHTFSARRAGIILRKAAFAFSEAKVSQPVQAAHGCRAPPSFTGCL